VKRGGAWNLSFLGMRSSRLDSTTATFKNSDIGFRVASLSELAAVIPEPSSAVLMLTGLAGLGLRHWRRVRN
jgi:hypothetical protein